MRLAVLVTLALLAIATPAAAAECIFELTPTTMRLTGDCSTDASIEVPDGVTLDGANYTITVVDPPDGHFTGAVIVTAGATASVVNTRITALSLVDICDGGAARLTGILFDAASGIIRGNVMAGLSQGASGCAEGNAIEVRNFDAGAAITTVEIADNDITSYQKTGIVAHGNVDAWIHHNRVGASASQALLTANGVQIGYGAWANVEDNQLAGNSWLGFPEPDGAATAVLIFGAANGTVVRRNTITGNADIAIYVLADDVIVTGNRLTDEGPDLGGYDIGVGNYGVGNQVTGNRISGYDTAVEGADGDDATSTVDLRVE